MGAEKGLPFLKKVMEYYERRDFVDDDGYMDSTTLPTVLARKLKGENLEIFPMDYFSPKNTRTLELQVTANTYSIHHFNGSWHSLAQQKHVALRTKLCKVFGEKLGDILSSFLAIFINIRYEGLGNTLKKVLAKLG